MPAAEADQKQPIAADEQQQRHRGRGSKRQAPEQEQPSSEVAAAGGKGKKGKRGKKGTGMKTLE